jgi:glutamyl-tRNA reductase
MQELFVVGVNQKTAGLQVRERLAFTREQLASALDALRRQPPPGLAEVAILSTCNRSEIYGVCHGARPGEEIVVNYLASTRGLPLESLREALFVYRGQPAARHLLRVAAGLDSMVVGECEIQGQVQDAYRVARGAGATAAILNALFQMAARAGKRVRTETEVGQTARSVADVVVDLAHQVLGDPSSASGHGLSERTALLVGAGKMSSLTGQALVSAGLRCVLVANRTHDRACKLAGDLGGRAVHFDALSQGLVEADVVICSTGAPHVVLHAEAVEKAMLLRATRPLLVVDIAVPRDVDPAVAAIPGVTLADMDSLEQLVRDHCPLTVAACQQAEAIVEQEVAAFEQWLAERSSAPVIRALYQKAEAIRREELGEALNKLGDLSPQQRKAVECLASSLVGKLLHDPVTQLKSATNGHPQDEYLTLARRLFNLPEARRN